MQTIHIPTAEELRDRLNGVDQLLTAKKWERAAIVYAFTEVQTNKGSGTRPAPTPPKRNIRDFAAQGYQGLSTPKAVSRYREAWVTAISNGWASPVEPGQDVELPDQPFPAWPYGTDTTWEDTTTGSGTRGPRSPNRPIQMRVIDALDRTANSLRELTTALTYTSATVEDDVRADLVERLTDLRREADAALLALTVELEPAH